MPVRVSQSLYRRREPPLLPGKFAGRTPVQQCWDYLNALPKCPWGIVSNFVTFRLYHRDKTPQVYEEFSLKEKISLAAA